MKLVEIRKVSDVADERKGTTQFRIDGPKGLVGSIVIIKLSPHLYAWKILFVGSNRIDSEGEEPTYNEAKEIAIKKAREIFS